MKSRYWMGFILGCALTAGAVPGSFNYQGVLRDGKGDVLPPGNKNVTFSLYSQATGGTSLWGRVHAVLLDTNGLFNVTLDQAMGSDVSSSTNKLVDVISHYPALYLGLKVEDSVEILPRQQLLSVPYAMQAGDVKEASADFTVGGILTAMNGLEAGVIQAKTHLEVGDTSMVTLTASDQGALVVTGLDVGSIGLEVSGSTTLNGVTTLNGATTISNLTGQTKIFSRLSKSEAYTNATPFAHTITNGPNTLLTADSDGFIVINLFYYIDAQGEGNEENEIYYNINFSGSTHERNVRGGLWISELDATQFRKYDALTLPILAGETVRLITTSWKIEGKTAFKANCFLVPFGTTVKP